MKKLALLVLVLACDKPAPAPAPAASSAAPAVVASSIAPAETAPAKPAAPPDWITAQHVLVAYKGAKSAPRNVTRTKEEARKRAEEVLEKAKSDKLEFADVVQMYSDDTESKGRMGSIGKITRDKVVKEFADAAFALKVDEVSGVIETPFGFHVIKRNQ